MHTKEGKRQKKIKDNRQKRKQTGEKTDRKETDNIKRKEKKRRQTEQKR